MKGFLGLLTLLGLSYAIADKSQIPAETEKWNRRMKWPALIAIAVALLFIFG